MLLASTAAPALQAAGFIGTWDTDVPAGRSVLDLGAASVLAGNPGLVGKPLPLDVALGRIHPEDRERVFGTIQALHAVGGPVAIEFRILTGTGETRWILDQGLLAPDEAGRLHGCGAYIDITELYRRWASPREDNTTPTEHLDAAADHCIQAHTALERHGDTALRQLSGMLLLGIGRALAQRAS
ncbi:MULTISPECIES: PAS domain-containing protein [unclassified Methylobacterium]|jgi:PAS fold|uniref:PAS domain-containing protein n=1 Tax=unclassified Methylobacterium TaxID=2615210 RepID=UPI00135316C0|nr:PAS domain-containing protein [Methylobacterium sp. 2A]MWV24925.1 PAS domain-containing protein [Methylobacterium sp. 2A]